MAFIVETVLADRRISLGNEEYLRQMSCGANWGKIRIGIRFAINGRNDIQDPAYLQLGLGCDATSYFSSDRPLGYIGCRFGGSSDNHPNVTYNSVQDSTSYYQFSTTEITTISKDNTGVVTQSARVASGGAAYQAIVASTVASNEHMFAATFGRAGNTYTLIDALIPNGAAAVQAGKTFTQFQADMDNETFANPTIANLTRTTTNLPFVIAPASFVGPPASYVSVYWSKATPTIEISHILVTKFF